MKHAFDTSGPSLFSKELQRGENLRKAMTKWVEKERKKGREPMYMQFKGTPDNMKLKKDEAE